MQGVNAEAGYPGFDLFRHFGFGSFVVSEPDIPHVVDTREPGAIRLDHQRA